MARSIRLDGERVSLTTFEPDDVEIVASGLGRLDPIAHPRSRRERESIERRVRHSGRFRHGRLDLAVRTRRGRLVGLVQARRRPLQCLEEGVISIGVVIFEPRDRRKGYAQEATALLTNWLFTFGADRVQAETSSNNVAMRRVLERVGFSLEGQLRSAAPGPTGREDIVMYAVVREDIRRIMRIRTFLVTP